MQLQQLINIGFNNYVVASRIISILSPSSSPMKRLREDAKAQSRLVDATQGRKTRSILVTDSNYVILSAIQPETISQRFLQEAENVEAQHSLDKGGTRR